VGGRDIEKGLKRVHASLLLAILSSACEPELQVGTWTCPRPDPNQDGGPKAVDVPWSTGFETGFCDYEQALGFCYRPASYTIVEAPVHGGRRAAAYSVIGDIGGGDAWQSRCFLEGALPREAVYGAWFYVPSQAVNNGNWNLIHFQGREPGEFHGLWDVSLRNADDGNLFAYLYNFLGPLNAQVPNAPPVPIGSWFHLEFRLRRAKDATGEVALYQDGALIQQASGLLTDDTELGQWYVGNYADNLSPPESTLYVDDVTIRPAP